MVVRTFLCLEEESAWSQKVGCVDGHVGVKTFCGSGLLNKFRLIASRHCIPKDRWVQLMFG